MHDYNLELVSESRARARAKARESALRESNKKKEAVKEKELQDARIELLEAEALVILKAREESKAAEDARINAAATDEWFYIQDEEQIGPVGLSQLIDILWNPLTEPPLKLVWTQGMDEWKPFYDVQKLSDSKPSGMSQTAQDHGSPHQLEATVAELRAAAEADLRAAAEAEAAEERANALEEKSKAENEARLREAAETKALEEARNASLAKANARKETELRMAAEAKADEQIKLRAAAEAKADEQIKLRAAAEARAEELEKLATAAEAKATLEAGAAIEEKSRAEEAARATASEESKLRAAAEAKALEESKLRIAAEAKAEELEKLATAAEAKAILEAGAAIEEKSRAEEAARATASEESKLRAAAEAKAKEESKLRIAAEAKAEELEKLAAAADAKANQQENTVADENTEDKENGRTKVTEESTPKSDAASPATARTKADGEDRATTAERKKNKAANKARIKAEKRARFQAAAKARAEAEQAEDEAKADVAREQRIAKDLPLKEESLKNSASSQPAKLENEIPEQKPGDTEHVKKHKHGGILSKNVWYYTCEGERRGPVSFDQLREMGNHSQLDPRLDMVWKLGTDLWKPAGEVDGLFERKNVTAKSKGAFEARKVFSTSNRKKSSDPQTANRIWPGARRRSFLLVTLVFPFAWQYALGAASPFLMLKFGETLMGHILPAATLLPLAVFVHFGMKRLMNLGMSRWWLLALSVPILNIWVGFRCFVCPDGYFYHKKLDRSAIAASILYGLAILACLIYPAATITPLFNALASPAIWKPLF